MAVAVLLAALGSEVAELTATVLLMAVPAGVAAATPNTTVKPADPAAKLGLMQLMVPALPTAGVVHDHPVATTIDWKLVFAGVFSVRLALVAVLGPMLLTTCE